MGLKNDYNEESKVKTPWSVKLGAVATVGTALGAMALGVPHWSAIAMGGTVALGAVLSSKDFSDKNVQSALWRCCAVGAGVIALCCFGASVYFLEPLLLLASAGFAAISGGQYIASKLTDPKDNTIKQQVRILLGHENKP